MKILKAKKCLAGGEASESCIISAKKKESRRNSLSSVMAGGEMAASAGMARRSWLANGGSVSTAT